MTKLELIETARRGLVEYVTLNRPALRNAFNAELIEEIVVWAERVARDKEVRAVVLAGAGASFCAGADAHWMRQTVGRDYAENLRDATALAHMFAVIDRLPFPVIAKIHGAAIGGGAGLAAVADIVVAETNTTFAFSEVRLGIVPAVISPFVIKKIGVAASRELFLTGIRFSAERARDLGLVSVVAAEAALDATIEEYLQAILASGPNAVAEAKRLIRAVSNRSTEDSISLTAGTIAAVRVSPEGQEGLNAFLDKRPPTWRTRL